MINLYIHIINKEQQHLTKNSIQTELMSFRLWRQFRLRISVRRYKIICWCWCCFYCWFANISFIVCKVNFYVKRSFCLVCSVLVEVLFHVRSRVRAPALVWWREHVVDLAIHSAIGEIV